ncbi:alpha/beta fold hydrolase [Roseivirga sp. BDSF3-8]|uniref:alpha/beta fold hydrolase n=1 Tax=Roseivirga sp. BDSF3-8 TaxID=3241598 RepID=UPI003531FB8F
MKFSKLIKLLMILALSFNMFGAVAQTVKYEETTSFYPEKPELDENGILWGYLTVPENWNEPEGNRIKIAVSIIRNWEKNPDANAVVYIQGGPGASAIENIEVWRRHPLRVKNNVILVDIRGTGFSEPRLCPELGRKFMEILAKDQSEEEDELQKASAAMSCKQSLRDRDIDVEAYHSLSVAKDLNALKQQLGYENWNVYGASYGTYMAQAYASVFPEDIRTLTLDSFIDDISHYYTENTSNFMDGLSRVFSMCENDPECNRNFPELEKVYYETISELEKSPITVEVSEDEVSSGEFTFNTEDFKVSVQQALYNKKLVEVIPLLIYEFKNRNDALGNLVKSFSQLLAMDYGLYYSVSCNETLPNNSYEEYLKNAGKYEGLNGPISFYKSDFSVCEKWNTNRPDSTFVNIDITPVQNADYPVLILAGEFDPITPLRNARNAVRKLKDGQLLTGYTYGHTPGFSSAGYEQTEAFINNYPEQKLNVEAFKEEKEIHFATNVARNAGIAKMGNSLRQPDPIFFLPILIAVLIMVFFVVFYTVKLIRKKYPTKQDKVIRILLALCSLVGLIGIIQLALAIIQVLDQNYFILAFGLPVEFKFIFTLFNIFLGLLALAVLFFIIQLKKINQKTVVFSVIFSNIILCIYLVYWGIV